MAGEWLKLECSTPEKLEVFSITTSMGWSDPDLTVGKLFRVWRWFDQQTIDGNAKGVTCALLDNISGAPGFAQAMLDAGWLVKTDDGVALPNFDRHNGATAKSRAQTAKRVANYRSDAPSNASCNAENVTPALAREEKKREEKKLTTKAKSRAEANAPASRLPADWSPTEADNAFCKTERPDLSPETTAQRFRDYWIAQPGAKGRKVDWPATWRNWVRNERGAPGAGGGRPPKFDPTAHVNRNRPPPGHPA